MVCSSHFPSDTAPRRTSERGLVRPPKDVNGGGTVILFDSQNELTLSVLPVSFHSVSPPRPEPAARPAPPASREDYATFFKATLAPLRRYIARLIGSHDEAQDIAQEAHAKLFAVMQNREIEHPQALLYATARNLAIDELKHRGRSPFVAGASIDTTPTGAPGVEAVVMAREEAQLLAQAINRLPEGCRQVFLLRMGDHLTHEQIGRRLGLTRKPAEKRLYHAVAILHAATHPPTKLPSES